MKAIKSFFTSTIGIATSFVLAAGLLLFGSVGGARAALTYYSESYQAQGAIEDVGVTLQEHYKNDSAYYDVANRDYAPALADGTWYDSGEGALLTHMLPVTVDNKTDSLKVGQSYVEKLRVQNSGTIDTYVRVTLYKYWVDTSDSAKPKTYVLHPDLIKLNLVNSGDWLLDTSATTAERTVLYYNKILPAGAVTPDFMDSITVDIDLAPNVSTKTYVVDGVTYKESAYDYNGYKFILKASVDAVQTHNAADAILSAWGKKVNVNNGILSI